MQTHAIIEIEEGTLSVTVGGRQDGRVRVLRSVRMPLQDLGRATVANALRDVGGELLQSVQGVHVILADRRSQHFLSTLPMMSPRDALAFVRREAIRLTNTQSADDVLLDTRLLRKLDGDRLLLGTAVVTRNVWSQIAAAFEDRDLAVLGLHTTEACLAMSTTTAVSEATAVLEYNAGRARFVLSIDQTPVQVRRFLIGGGGEASAATVVTQLMMELPRTFDWLREIGQPTPRWLQLGTRVPVEEESLDMLRGDALEQVSRAEPDIDVDEGQAMPTLSVATLLHRLANNVATSSLLDANMPRLPWRRHRYVALAAAAALSVLLGASAVVDGRVWWKVRQQHEQLIDEFVELQVAASELAPQAAPQSDELDPQLQRALTMRRPISLLIADVSNCCTDGVSLEQVAFASVGQLVVTGEVESRSRQQALSRLATFFDRLRRLPYLQTGANEELQEVPGDGQRFRFKVSLSWRNE